jgi:hypothetical protein
MTLTLVEALRGAVRRRGEWNRDRAKRAIEYLLAAIAGSRLDWDEGAGEAWARLVIGDDLAALISLEWPLVLVRASLEHYTGNGPELEGAETFPVSDFDDRRYSIDDVLTEGLGIVVTDAEFDPRHFSLKELWWATV